VTSGTPITVALNEHVAGIAFELPRAGGISGQLINELTGSPIARFNVRVYDSSGDLVDYLDSGLDGFYTVRGLDAGNYFVVTDEYYSSSYYNELYDNIPCWYGPPDSCDPTKGTPVAVTLGQVTRFVDFALTPRSSSLSTGVSGKVTDVATGDPIQGVIIDFWSTDTVDHVASVATDVSGSYFADLDPGTYFVSTDNGMGWTNLIWRDVKCRNGSVYDGTCEPEEGEPVAVIEDEITSGIDFVMSGLLFEDGFESGDASAWSVAVH
jgi:hypothetical protein